MYTSSSTLAMDSIPKIHHSRLSFLHRHSLLPKPFTSLSFRSLPSTLPFSSSSQLSCIRASSPSQSPKDHSSHKPRNAFTYLLQNLNPLFSPLFEPAYVAIAAVAFFFMRVQLNPVATAKMLAPPAAESSAVTTENPSDESAAVSTDEENEKAIEEQLSKNPGDANVIRSLVEVKVRARKIGEAIQLLDRLIELDPEEFEWPLLKAHLYGHNGEHELARNGFEDLLKKDPLFTEAYHRSAADLFDVLPQRNIHKLFDAISERGEPKLFAEMPKRDVLNLFAIMLTHLKGMEVAKKAGCLLSYDLNSRLPLWPARQQILGTWKSVELVKVYWPPIICDKCFDAYILAGFDMVIHDGVGVLFVSLNGSASTSFNNSVSIGSFHASKKRIVVVFSAGIGNSRPAVGLWLFALLNNKLEGCNDSTVFFSFLVESLF